MDCLMRETRIIIINNEKCTTVPRTFVQYLEGLVLESRACQSSFFTARSLIDWGDATHAKELILCFVLKAGLHKRRSRSLSRNQRRAYDLVKTAFRFPLRLRRLRSAYDLVKTRWSESEAEAELLNQSQSVGTSIVVGLSFRFCFRLRQSGFH